jgi:four helix bundle protein
MTSTKRYDLKGRTFKFAQEVIRFVGGLPKTSANGIITDQVVRSSGSVGANYIEANECLSKKDFSMRVRICRKEAKETAYWLRLLEIPEEVRTRQQSLVDEATQVTKIFGAIVEKTK